MLISAHSIVGGVIGQEISNPALAFFAGIISHLLLDSIPHNDGPDDSGKDDQKTTSASQYVVIFADLLLAAIIIGYFYYRNLLLTGFLWGVFGGVFPDLVDNMPFWENQIRKVPVFKQFHALHYRLQKIKAPIWIGLPMQYVIVAISIWLFLR